MALLFYQASPGSCPPTANRSHHQCLQTSSRPASSPDMARSHIHSERAEEGICVDGRSP